MKKQNPFVVFILTLITFGIYAIFWYARTRGEMNKLGANVPTTWLIIIPLVNIYYFWKWSEGVQIVSDSKMNGLVAFILQLLLGAIGMAIVQSTFNSIGNDSLVTQPLPITPQQPVTPTVQNNVSQLGNVATEQNNSTIINNPTAQSYDLDKQNSTGAFQENENINNNQVSNVSNNYSQSTQPMIDVVKPAQEPQQNSSSGQNPNIVLGQENQKTDKQI